MIEIPDGIRRITFPLPLPLAHVHCYLLRSDDGWTLVDTGLGLPDLEERWQPFLAELDAPVTRIVITHMHPDHCGGGAVTAALTGAPVWQGEIDYEQCARVWSAPEWEVRIADWFRLHGVPSDVSHDVLEAFVDFRAYIDYARDPEPLRPGESVDGWQVALYPGHADGHLCLLKDGVLIAGDHLLPKITPTIGLYPDARPDPLGDYLESLQRVVEVAPRLALPGHGEPIDDPAGRALEIADHHRKRLDELTAALSSEPQSGYELSLVLFGRELAPMQRRFAVAETLSHLERLVVTGRAARADADGTVTYTQA